MNAFKEARKIPLLPFLVRTMKAKEHIIGGGTRLCTCPNCGGSKSGDMKLSVKGDFWRCFQCGLTGDITKAASMLWNCSQKDAAEKLVSGERPSYESISPSQVAANKKAQDESVEAMTRAVSALKDACGIQRPAVDYLKSRGIKESTILEAAMQNQVSFLPCNPLEAFGLLREAVGDDDLRLSGLWREDAKAPGVIYRPMVSFLGESSMEFRLARKPNSDSERKAIRYGRATTPWRLEGNEAKGTIITEGVIDMLSLRELGFAGTILATPGCNSWRSTWFTPLIANPKVKIAFDNDAKRENPGQVWANKLKEALQALDCQATVMSPPPGMDVNDLLLSKGQSS